MLPLLDLPAGERCAIRWLVHRSARGVSAGIRELASFKSSEHATRTFCARCGTPITFQSTHYPNEIDITTGSLDDPEQIRPDAHTYVASGLTWVRMADGLPAYPDKRPEYQMPT